MKGNPELITITDYQKTCFRYHFSSKYIQQKDVLEIGMGYKGLGLTYLSNSAKSVVGTDYDKLSVDIANRTHIKDNISIKHLDANGIFPFDDESFDVVLALETIYYFNEIIHFLTECSRILKPGGTLIISQHNKEFPGQSNFNKHYTCKKLIYILEEKQFKTKVYGAFSFYYEQWIKIIVLVLKMAKKIIGVNWYYIVKTPLTKEIVNKYCSMIKSHPLLTNADCKRYRYLYIVAKANKFHKK